MFWCLEEKKTKLGKCKFSDSWLEMPEFKDWIKLVENNNQEAYCTLCKKKISVASMGINAVKSHMQGASASFFADIRVAMWGTPTLRAEVIWCLNTVVNHHSLNSNEGISDIFKSMFPDSDIAKTFTCGKDKTGYIMRFWLAPYFKQQLVDSINKAGLFVLMFDEFLNQSTKKKQLDVHVRFWEDDCVQSRYLGSQFLGHGTAEDLLHHIKVSVLCTSPLG